VFNALMEAPFDQNVPEYGKHLYLAQINFSNQFEQCAKASA
jgi:hypothetical protein